MKARLLWLVAVPVVLMGMFVRGDSVPLARLLANVQKYVDDNPKDAQGHYTLGRLHSLAFSEMVSEVRAIERDRLPVIADRSHTGATRDPKNSKVSEKSRRHFEACVQEYRRAIGIEPTAALYHYSLGWMLEQGKAFGIAIDRLDATKEALSEYRKAFDLAEKADLDKVHLAGIGQVSAEAGMAILQIRGAEMNSNKFSGDAEIDRIRVHIRKLNSKGLAITPVIFATRPKSRLSDLTSRNTVDFNLDGFSFAHERWPWLRAEAAMLVWDPQKTGKITSGKQLFGSVTWWMFWRNGYEPLAALDDDQDGWLTGDELAGIGVWIDKNENGVSDPGEVVPVEQFGITGIATRANNVCEGAICNQGGIRMKDGTVLPSFDWVPVTEGEVVTQSPKATKQWPSL